MCEDCLDERKGALDEEADDSRGAVATSDSDSPSLDVLKAAS